MADRILTTHAGSLPRPDDLADMIWARLDGQEVDEATLEANIDAAVGRERLLAGTTAASTHSSGSRSSIPAWPG